MEIKDDEENELDDSNNQDIQLNNEGNKKIKIIIWKNLSSNF